MKRTSGRVAGRRPPAGPRPGSRPAARGPAAPRRPRSAASAVSPASAVRPLSRPLEVQAAEVALCLLVFVPPLLFLPSARESFRLPKLMLSEWLGLASLLALAFRLRAVPVVRWADLARRPVLRAVVPLVLVALAGLAVSRHPLHLRQALADLAIGAACLAGWSLGLEAERLRRLLDLMLWPAAALALFGILQFHGAYRPLQFLGLAAGSRLAITSFAGNPGDLAAYLVLPCLLAQRKLARASGAERWGAAAVLALAVYALAATQTLAALAAAAVGSVVLWGMRLPLRRRLGAAAAAAAAAAAVLLLIAALPPLRARVAIKALQMRSGDWNAVLSGRLDGWRTAAFMLAEHPLAGVGQGGFRAEFAPAKLALLDRGIAFYPDQPNASFANAHNELLEVGADLGWPGLAALAWGIGMLWTALRRLRDGEREAGGSAGETGAGALAWAGAAALAVLSISQFPFRLALVAFPALLFLAWTFRAAVPAQASAAPAKDAPA
jgi:O-antigen ligase